MKSIDNLEKITGKNLKEVKCTKLKKGDCIVTQAHSGDSTVTFIDKVENVVDGRVVTDASHPLPLTKKEAFFKVV